MSVVEQLPITSPDSEKLTGIERKEIKTKSWLHNPALKLGALGLALTTAGYWGGVVVNQNVQKEAEITVNEIAGPLDSINDNSAIIFFDGFATYDADTITQYLGPASQHITDGDLWSISYGNAPLDEKVISNKIVTLAEKLGVTHVTIEGQSMGGNVGTKVASILYNYTDLVVDRIGLRHTPDGVDGLEPESKAQYDFMEVLSAIPGAKYSNAVRTIGEMVIHQDRYNGSDSNKPDTLEQRAKDFTETWNDTQYSLENPELPGMWLMSDQLFALADADIKTSLKTIAESDSDKPKPVITYTQAPEGTDRVVNNQYSATNICADVQELDMQCFVNTVEDPHFSHENPYNSAPAYNELALSTAPILQKAIEKEQNIAKLGLFLFSQDDTFLVNPNKY